MQYDRDRATADFRRTILWIVVAGIALVAGALWYLSLYGPLRLHMVVATVAGVFVSVLLGCGLFAAGFFSDKSGHDRAVTDATAGRRGEQFGEKFGLGTVSKLCAAPVTAQGSFSRVQVSTKGGSDAGAFSIVERTLTKSSMPSGRVNSQLMQCGQKW